MGRHAFGNEDGGETIPQEQVRVFTDAWVLSTAAQARNSTPATSDFGWRSKKEGGGVGVVLPANGRIYLKALH